MAKKRMYQSTKKVRHNFTLTVNEGELRVDFKGGGRLPNGNIKGGKFLTLDPDVMKAMEETPYFKRGEIIIVMEDDKVNDASEIANPDVPEAKSNVKIPIKPRVPAHTPLIDKEIIESVQSVNKPEKVELEEAESTEDVENENIVVDTKEEIVDDGLLTSEATGFQEARTYLKANFPEESPISFQSAAKVKEFATKNGVSFPKWIE